MSKSLSDFNSTTVDFNVNVPYVQCGKAQPLHENVDLLFFLKRGLPYFRVYFDNVNVIRYS